MLINIKQVLLGKAIYDYYVVCGVCAYTEKIPVCNLRVEFPVCALFYKMTLLR